MTIDLDAILKIVDVVSRLSGPTLIILILVLGYKGIWVWGNEAVRAREDYEKRLNACAERAQRWEDRTLRLLNVTEQTVAIAKSTGAPPIGPS